ncbi:hypothetical protein OEW28_15870 [Defluviimonas sp. WL0002]|uniref:Uncharacterized protein n=1 Tax=Albidovulum marisflavi TaxID=2984159 RepID=A0ABT2ZG42_9RHOB|nr:hypothetical protein [Defluviimonas sp. WL0002]MCV2870107.1 hypothetical protein [Defluviimonas sp. WL0002]
MTLTKIGLWGLLAERLLMVLWISAAAIWSLPSLEEGSGNTLLIYAAGTLAPWIVVLCIGLVVMKKQWHPGIWTLGIVASLWAIVDFLPTLRGVLATAAVTRAGDTSFLFLSSGRLVSWACVVLVGVGCFSWLRKSYRVVQ